MVGPRNGCEEAADPAGCELLDRVAVLVGHVEVAGRVERQACRIAQPRAGKDAADPARREPLDRVVGAVGRIEVAGCIERQEVGVVEPGAGEGRRGRRVRGCVEGHNRVVIKRGDIEQAGLDRVDAEVQGQHRRQGRQPPPRHRAEHRHGAASNRTGHRRASFRQVDRKEVCRFSDLCPCVNI